MKINTSPPPPTNMTPEQVRKSIAAWIPVERAYREDPGFRRRLAEDAAAAVAEHGLELPEGIREVRVAENTAEVFHLAFPRDPNASVPDRDLDQVAGGTGSSAPAGGAQPPVGPRITYTNPVTGVTYYY